MKNTGQFDLDGAKCARQVTGILFSRPLQSATTMENTPLNVFILGSHALVLNGLKHKLQQKFGSTMATSIFCDVNSCMKKVDNLTHVLVIDELVEGRAAEDWASQFRAIHPDIEVLVHRSSEQVIQQLRMLLHRRLMPEAASVFALV